jgi:hypothetical protein
MKARRCLIFFFDVNHAFRFENEEKCTFIVELLLTLFAVCPRSSLQEFPISCGLFSNNLLELTLSFLDFKSLH